MVQTPLKFSGSVLSSLQPAGFVFSNAFVRFLAVKWTLSAAMCDCRCFGPGAASSPKTDFCMVYNVCFTSCGLAVQIGNSSSTWPVFCFSLPVQKASSGCKHSPSLCAVLGYAHPTQLTWACTSTGQEPVSPCCQVQLSWGWEQHFREEHGNSECWEDTSALALTFTKAGINKNEEVCTRILLPSFLSVWVIFMGSSSHSMGRASWWRLLGSLFSFKCCACRR